MVRVLFDHQIFTYQPYGGISRYFSELMNQFSHNPAIRFTVALRASWNRNLSNKPGLIPYWSNRNRILSTSPILPYIQKKTGINLLKLSHINRNESIRMLQKTGFDVFHPTYYHPYFLKKIHTPFVLTVHDMTHELCSGFFSDDPIILWKKELISRADAIIAISKNTKNDLVKVYSVDPDRISVIYDANPFEFQEFMKSPAHEDPGIPMKPYLLFVGTRPGYKNFNFFITAIADFLKREDIHVWCAGGGLFNPAEQKTFRDLDITSHVHTMDVDDQRMQYLYSNATAFVFPSLHEGFGLPVLESFSCGCPVILSNTSALPEIGSDAARYFDPRDPVSLVSAVESVYRDERVREDLIRRGYARVREFSWKKTAEGTRKIYEQVVSTF